MDEKLIESSVNENQEIIEGKIVLRTIDGFERLYKNGDITKEILEEINSSIENRLTYALQIFRKLQYCPQPHNKYSFTVGIYIKTFYDSFKNFYENRDVPEFQKPQLLFDFKLSEKSFVKGVEDIGLYGIEKALDILIENSINPIEISNILTQYFSGLTNYLYVIAYNKYFVGII